MDQILRFQLKNKTALVTGASAGIGEAICLKLAALGVKVFAVARREDKLATLAKKSSKIVPMVADVRGDLSGLQELAKKEAVDLLINNAGMAAGRSDILGTSLEQVDQMIDTNVRSLIAVTKIFLPKMKENNFGDVVNLGSIAGLFTYPGGSVYSATKFAVHALSQGWRQDLSGTDVRVIEICPGMVETEFSVVRFGGDQEKAKQVYQGMRPLTAEDIAESILWSLAQPRHLTIQSMVVMPTDQAAMTMIHRK